MISVRKLTDKTSNNKIINGEKFFKKIVNGLFFLSIILEVIHFIIPNRSFQLDDLMGNILGVTVAYLVIKIYLFFR